MTGEKMYIFPTATELCHLIVGQTLLSLLCSMDTRMEVICEKTREFSNLSDLQDLCVCVYVCVCVWTPSMRVCVCVCVHITVCVSVC